MTAFVKIFRKRYPQNFILRNPATGTLMFLIICMLFIILYKPLGTKPARTLSYAATMTIYCTAISVVVYVMIRIVKRIKYFSDSEQWTIVREITAILLVLSGMGTGIYFLGFLIEAPSNRWNLDTFLDSFLKGIGLGIIPFAFFSFSNYRHLILDETIRTYSTDASPQHGGEIREERIRISSKLKKEELSFYPGQFIYAESDGNYVVFCIEEGQTVRKEIIRNSISNIEQQLSVIPFVIRTHRAFIVNLKKVISSKGNTLGYRLKLRGTDTIVPVSRQNVHDVEELMKQLG
jgi:hypothetical protein